MTITLTRTQLALTALVIGVALMRLALVLTHDNYLGVDGGAYLLSRNAVLGWSTGSEAFARPPLAPGWQLVAPTLLFGDDLGFKLWNAVAGLPLISAAFLFSRRFLSPGRALAAAAFVAVDLHLAEMLVTGSLPLQGFALILVALWAAWPLMDTDAREFRWRYVAVIAGVIPLTLLTNQTSGALIGVVLIALVVLATVAYKRSTFMLAMRVVVSPFAFLPLTLAGALGVAASLPVIALWYLDLAPGASVMRYPGPLVYVTNWADSAWMQFAFGWAVAVYVWRSADDFRLRAFAGLLALTSSLAVFMSFDEGVMNIFYRSRYLAQVLFWPLTVFAFMHVVARWPSVSARAAAYTLPVLLLPAMVYGDVWIFERQTQYSDQVTVASAEMLDALQMTQSQDGIITNTFSMSHWVSALTGRRSPWVWQAEPPERWTREYAEVRCVLGWRGEACDVAGAVEELGSRWVLIDTRFPKVNARSNDDWLAPPDAWAVTRSTPWLREIAARDTSVLYWIDVERAAETRSY